MLFGIRCSRSAYVATSQGLSIRLLPRWTRWARGGGQGAGKQKRQHFSVSISGRSLPPEFVTRFLFFCFV